MSDDLVRRIQEKNALDYQRIQKQKKEATPPPLLRISEYHSETGRYKTLYPNGGQVIAGVKLFNSSVPDGTPVRSTQAYGAQSIGLDYRNTTIFPDLPDEILVKQTEFINQEKPNLADTYIIIFVDISGSMENEVPAITDSLLALKEFLKIEIYETQERVEKYFQIKYDDSERWLYWMSVGAREDNEDNIEPNKAIILAFINEANSAYHQIPRNTSLEPTLLFTDDLNEFINAYDKREFFKGKIYSVQYPPDPELETSFSAHVRDAIDGISPYPSPGLQAYNLSHTLGLPASTLPEVYLEDIKNLLGL